MLKDSLKQSAVYRYQFSSSRGESKERRYRVRAKVWLYPGMAGWHFITLPVATSKLIKKRFGFVARGWGSLRVKVTLGNSSWDTSIFPDKKLGAYVLPLKASIRKAEGVRAKDLIALDLNFI